MNLKDLSYWTQKAINAATRYEMHQAKSTLKSLIDGQPARLIQRMESHLTEHNCILTENDEHKKFVKYSPVYENGLFTAQHCSLRWRVSQLSVVTV